jgi:hypothetical protein
MSFYDKKTRIWAASGLPRELTLAPDQTSMLKMEFWLKIMWLPRNLQICKCHKYPRRGGASTTTAPVREASGKPSTWFPLGEHVPKELCESRVGFSTPFRSIWEVSSRNDESLWAFFWKFNFRPLTFSIFIKRVLDRFCSLPYDCEHALASIGLNTHRI